MGPWGVFSSTPGSMFDYLESMFNYPGEYYRLPRGVFSATLGGCSTTLGVCSTTLRSIFNYPGEYPTALRAIPATVPPAFCVLRSVLWGRPGNSENAQQKKQKISENRSKTVPKIDQKSSKIEVWRGPGRAGG